MNIRACIWVIISESTNRLTNGQRDGRARPISAVQVGAVGGHGRRKALEEQQPRARGGGRWRVAIGSARRAVMQQQRSGERARAAHLLERERTHRAVVERKCDDLRHLHAHVCLSARYIHTKERARPKTRSGDVDKGGRKAPIATSAVCVGEVMRRPR